VILVLDVAKTLSTSAYQVLADRFPGEVHRCLGLESWIVDPSEAYLESAGAGHAGLRQAVGEAAERDRVRAARDSQEPLALIAGVRDPVDHALSVAVQLLDTVFADCKQASEEATVEALSAQLHDLWTRPVGGSVDREFKEILIRAPLEMFARELEEACGFDFQKKRFNARTGYSIYSKGRNRLLVYRHDRAPVALEKGLSKLFEGETFSLPDDEADAAATGGVYAALRDRFRLPRDLLVEIYGQPPIRRFFTQEEIDAALDHWSEVSGEGTAAMPDEVTERPATPAPATKATIFVPLHNNAGLIGDLLDSLFAQWRSDVDLLLIDDGSTDGGLQVALDRLSQRPDIRATVMRHWEATGHGVVADLTRFTTAPILIQADSDDLALPGRLDAILDCFERDPSCRLVTSNAVLLSDGSIPMGLYDSREPDRVFADPTQVPELWGGPFWLGATSAFHRSVVEDFPPVDPELVPYGLDLLTGLRAMLLGTHHYLSRPLVGWRQHARNGHRSVGVGAADVETREKYAALEMMVFAQRIRDIEFRRAASDGADDPSGPERLSAALSVCSHEFARNFECWARLRNRMDKRAGCRSVDADVVAPATRGGPPLPPVVTLETGIPVPMSDNSQLARAAARWPGFHEPEAEHIWTERHALITVRIADPAAAAIELTCMGPSFFADQIVSVSTNFGPPVTSEADTSGFRKVRVPLEEVPVGVARTSGYLTLLVSVNQAEIPRRISSDIPDDRLLGAMLGTLLVI